MAGTVWEWLADRYGPGYYGLSPQRNPLGSDSGNRYGLRGGSFAGDARTIRCAHRGWDAPYSRSTDLRFRVVMSAEPSVP